jgi:hypothetical protein
MPNPYLTAFNNQFLEFVEDILRLFPNDKDLITTKNSLLLMKKMNPRLIVMAWRDFIAMPYANEIETGGLEFFLNKDYSGDLSTMPDARKILDVIERLRVPLRNLHDDDKVMAMKYISNLTKLSLLYA